MRVFIAAIIACCFISIIVEYFSIKWLLNRYEKQFVKPFLYPVIYANLVTNFILFVYIILKKGI